ncbi:AI-2E family transporter [Bacillus aquiflavi]|uniref:AI-2E family transporter n=1 Tax=Bacillus aquiflavi TaxID=2672567 RepID=A0A6B3W584_9BACI|nr:AI-2E family transporter [Bacillus aquiflavi]MBA4538528.1 AI-2E family transporter [Bacillus aquiflavi]NEY82891.1 AI-2E family transporter [Bacillus aquiflavi]UAC47343.1 AI-2E family transporter [Bacillus aquiflavi]
MDIQIKWFYRLGFLLLLFIVTFIFWKLQQVWLPILKVTMTILSPFLIAAFITYLLNPIIERLHDSGLHRGVSVLIIYLLFFGGVGYALYKGIPVFIDELKDLSEDVPAFAEQYRNWLSSIQKEAAAWPNGIKERIYDGIIEMEKAIDRFLTSILNGMLNVLNAFVLIALIPFIAFYMLKDYNVLKKAVWYLTPRKWRKEGVLFLQDVDQSLGGYIRGQLLVCVIVGALSALLLWLIGMKYALLLGFIIGITNVIPYFGPLIGAFPAVVIAATTSMKMVVITLVIVFTLQFVEGNILSPFIVGKTLQMHPLLIMFSLLAGGEIAGILGLILAVPVLAILRVGLLHGRVHFAKRKRESEST